MKNILISPGILKGMKGVRMHIDSRASNENCRRRADDFFVSETRERNQRPDAFFHNPLELEMSGLGVIFFNFVPKYTPYPPRAPEMQCKGCVVKTPDGNSR